MTDLEIVADLVDAEYMLLINQLEEVDLRIKKYGSPTPIAPYIDISWAGYVPVSGIGRLPRPGFLMDVIHKYPSTEGDKAKAMVYDAALFAYMHDHVGMIWVSTRPTQEQEITRKDRPSVKILVSSSLWRMP